MSSKMCSICAAPDSAAETVNAMLQKRIPLKQIALETGFSKSALHRHSQKCFVRHKASAIKEKRFDAERSRVLTALPDGNFFVQHDPLDASLSHATITESEQRADDWIIRLIYEPETAPRELKEPEPEDIEAEEVSETGVAADDTFSDAALDEEIKVAADDIETAKATPCEHIMVRVSGDISRCQLCGHQEQPPVIVGVSRKWHEEHNRDIFSKRPKFGRF